jgi:hypothetical protein
MSAPVADPVEEGRRLVQVAGERGVVFRLLGGVAVYLQSPNGGPLLPRVIGDIDVVTKKGNRAAVTDALKSAGYVPDEMFNAVHAARRLLFYDEQNQRKLDVFVGEFVMCHSIPITDRLDRQPLTLPLAELLLTKLQIVQLNERDQRDIYNLTYHHPVTDGDGSAIEGDYVAAVLAQDWGFWRTSKSTIERCKANLGSYGLEEPAAATITERLDALWRMVESAPKTARWRLRSRVGDRMRWYEEPEEHVDHEAARDNT